VAFGVGLVFKEGTPGGGFDDDGAEIGVARDDSTGRSSGRAGLRPSLLRLGLGCCLHWNNGSVSNTNERYEKEARAQKAMSDHGGLKEGGRSQLSSCVLTLTSAAEPTAASSVRREQQRAWAFEERPSSDLWSLYQSSAPEGGGRQAAVAWLCYSSLN